MDYIGEHLMPGKIGNLLIIVSLVSSLIACFSYYKSFRTAIPEEQSSWKRLGRIAFLVDAVSVIGVFVLLYTLISNHRYEYLYVYKNSGNDLEPKYIFSSLWSASEGSFLLWTVWHAILGSIVMFTAKRWEGPVMSVISFAQLCLSVLLLGIYIGGEKIGSSPFALFREEMSHLPVFGYADYATRIVDGNGLNQLLQNYWMVIHPPVLFAGFASMIIPFAFAVGGLLVKDKDGWTKPALPWSLLAAALLGVGVMMGAAWAYESLSFGGYWAWDPVENASMVPWLVLVAGIHTLLIYRHTGRSLNATYLLLILSFLLIIYSTFLTRSGVLGDSSVHSFADLGMNSQLYLFLYTFFWLPVLVAAEDRKQKLIVGGTAVVLLLAANFATPWFAILSPVAAIIWFMMMMRKKNPSMVREEDGSSREFWMFIGSLVLFFSAFLIILQTSIPVFNAVFKTNIAEPENREFSYNRVQIFIAIIIGLLTAVVQYMRYKQTPAKALLRKLSIPTIATVFIAGLIIWKGEFNYTKYGVGYNAAIILAVITSVYTIIANLSYIWLGIKGSLRLSGPSVAHLGFGMMLLGILISASKKEVLSHNINGIPAPLGEKEDPRENLTLIKGTPTVMDKYTVTYTKDSVHSKKPKWYYRILFESSDGKEKFTLMPNAFVNYQNQEGLMANPDAKRYWDHDIFTYITSIPDPDKNKDTSSFRNKTVRPGDTVFYNKGYIILDSILDVQENLPEELFGKDGKLYSAKLTITAQTGSIYTSTPKLALAKGNWLPVPDTITAENVVLQLNKVDGKSVELGVKESGAVLQYLTLKAYKFPFINLLWLGTVLMTVGFIISMVRRIRTTMRVV